MTYENLYEKDNLCFDKNASLIINRKAIERNLQIVRCCTNKKVIAVIKENGYGLGIANYYNILKNQKVDAFAVTSLSEAIALRNEGCEKDIIMLVPIIKIEELKRLIKNNIIIALGYEGQLSTLTDAARQTGIRPRVHIQIDTGMGRYGFEYDRVPDLSAYASIFSIEGCFTHLAGSQKNYRKSVETQVHYFRKAIDKIKGDGVYPGICHISNSKATLNFGDLGFDAVRVGSALIGKVASPKKLEEAVWLESEVFSVYRRKAGEHIGYQGEAALKKDSDLAIIRVGTGCGIGLTQRGANDFSILAMVKGLGKRILSVPVMRVGIKNLNCPVVGRLGVSHMTVDVTNCQVGEGDTVKIQVNPLLVHPAIRRIVV